MDDVMLMNGVELENVIIMTVGMI